jgi:hypothetical protein
MASDSRDRLTIDMRGMRERLQGFAVSQGLSTSAVVRRALMELLVPGPDATPSQTMNALGSGDLVKVTLRLPAAFAELLKRRSREASVPQGVYVAGLVDGVPPPPLPRDHSDAIAALRSSTDQLAAIGTDLNALMRLLRLGPSPQVQGYRDRAQSLVEDVRRHLDVASDLIAQVRAARGRR